MKLMADAVALKYIPVTAGMVPCTLDIKLDDKTYRMAFKYNEEGAFFSVDLSVPVPNNVLLCYGEIIRYGKSFSYLKMVTMLLLLSMKMINW